MSQRFEHLVLDPTRCRATSCLMAFAAVAAISCRSSDLLRVPTPPSVVSQGSLADTTGAEAIRAGAIGEFAAAIDAFGGMIALTGMLSDEMRIGYTYAPGDVGVDARTIALSVDAHGSFDRTYTLLQAARVMSLQAVTALEQHPSARAPAEIGELFALSAYSEILLGEVVCSGDPLSVASPSGAVIYGQPLSTDSIFGRALAHLDSALAHGASEPTVLNLAAVGRGRALLGLGRPIEAGSAVAGVAPSFVYGTQLPSTGYYAGGFYRNWATFSAQSYTVGDKKGGNGLDFVSARDARVVTILQGTTGLGLPAYYPAKFPQNAVINDSIPLADAVEAQLIAAEGALASGNVTAWLGALNQLRANFVTLRGSYPADTSYHPLQPLVDPGSDSARVSLMFRERAFWLYGTGHRLGDLRRLVRRYGRDQSAVFPTGPYDNGSGTAFYSAYGTSVNFPIGAIEASNPNFHGCSSTEA